MGLEAFILSKTLLRMEVPGGAGNHVHSIAGPMPAQLTRKAPLETVSPAPAYETADRTSRRAIAVVATNRENHHIALLFSKVLD